uniref:Uncharacterized protein n=1 Tax=Lepeophtheirus salmonis TaxID=72036 RepID=A0A0K2ULX7_LEPSM
MLLHSALHKAFI